MQGWKGGNALMDVEALRKRQAELVGILAVAQSPLELARASGELESLNRELERAQAPQTKSAPAEQ